MRTDSRWPQRRSVGWLKWCDHRCQPLTLGRIKLRFHIYDMGSDIRIRINQSIDWSNFLHSIHLPMAIRISTSISTAMSLHLSSYFVAVAFTYHMCWMYYVNVKSFFKNAIYANPKWDLLCLEFMFWKGTLHKYVQKYTHVKRSFLKHNLWTSH